ncbi:MAG: NAD-dependent epimerase/dehydratase family protein, partial [Desulfobacterales bacterium]|nr:NAD-dependent epimerase/dehydratase family protein [Desulfobacterales bacterium]
VTGGGGFLGSAIVRRLVGRGRGVLSFARTRHATLEGLAVEQIQGDVADPRAVLEACKGVELVFHTAAKPGVWGAYRDYYRTNVLGTRNVLEACRVHGVPRLIHTSSPSVVFDGRDMAGVDESAPYPSRFRAHYPRTKALAEQAVRAAAGDRLKVLILRPHLIWGPGDNHLVPRILARADRLARIGDGANRVDTTYIDNAAEAHLLAADRLAEDPGLSGRVYFISQGEPIPLWEMIDLILQAGGRPPVRRRLSRKTAWLLGAALEMVYRGLRRQQEPPLTRFVAEELATAHWFDIGAARRELGYSPGVSTAEGLARLTRWLQNPEHPGAFQ